MRRSVYGGYNAMYVDDEFKTMAWRRRQKGNARKRNIVQRISRKKRLVYLASFSRPHTLHNRSSPCFKPPLPPSSSHSSCSSSDPAGSPRPSTFAKDTYPSICLQSAEAVRALKAGESGGVIGRCRCRRGGEGESGNDA